MANFDGLLPQWEAYAHRITEEKGWDDGFETRPLDDAEMVLARKFIAQMRAMASMYRVPGDAAPYMRDADGDLPDDDRPVSPSHSIGGFRIEHYGEYWEVSEYSIEFSSNYSSTGRGRSLEDAFEDLERHRG